MNQEFETHLLNEAGIENGKRIADIFDEALENLLKLVPPSRYQSMLRTKLEEAAFFAKKGMAYDPANQKSDAEKAWLSIIG